MKRVLLLIIFMLVIGCFAQRAAQNPKLSETAIEEPSQNIAGLEQDMRMYGHFERPTETWIQSDGQIYGAIPDERGPIGGGEGYKQLVTEGDFRVSNLDQLLYALENAQSGQVIFIEGGAEIDCTTRVYVDNLRLEIPANVTLASDRGQDGSRGAMIFSDALTTRPLIILRGGNVRITGLRIRGPDPERRMDHYRRSFVEGRGSNYYDKFPVSQGIYAEDSGLEVDNCELAGWSHAAILLGGGGGHHIHHNYIHHNQYNGLGYGICLDTAEALIEGNLFNFNRHSISGTGRPGTSYEAAYNVEMGESLSHCFDMHGGEDRKDGTDIAGTWIKIHHNTFFPKHTHVIGIRGTPEQDCQIYKNWFPNHYEPKSQDRLPRVLREARRLWKRRKGETVSPDSSKIGIEMIEAAIIRGERTFIENNKYGR